MLAQAQSAICNPQSAIGQFLNPLDLALACVDQTIREMGYPGFETQMLVWLGGRVDLARLKQAIDQLADAHPVITARLRANLDGHGQPHWEFQPDEAPAVHQVVLRSDDEAAVRDAAADLLSTPADPAEFPPLRFYVLHRPGGRDVFLMQYNHVLMDNSAPLLVVRAIDRLSQGMEEAPLTGSVDSYRLLHRFVRRYPHAQRRTASVGAVEVSGRGLRGRAAILGSGHEGPSLIYQGAESSGGNGAATNGRPRPVLRLATCSLDREATQAIAARSAAVCGIPQVSMAILASTFRAIRRLGPEERNASRNYVAGIGLDLNLRQRGQPLFGNLLSLVPIGARPEELADRDELVRLLSRQIRSRLEAKIDLGMVRLASGFRRKVRHMHWALAHVLRYSYSLWYAYFGALDAIGPTFCGTPIENAFYTGPAWGPMGIGLLVNQWQGRLQFQLTYDPFLVPEPLANEFLELLLADLA